jgi:peptidyl-prolyl cis-trans isomerase SurA
MRGPRGRTAVHVSGIGLGTMLCFMLVSHFGAGFPHRLRAEITNRIVAIVNTDIITLHELNTSIKRITGLNAEELRVEDEERFYEAGRAVLDSLINDKITKQQITTLGIEIAQRDIDEAIEKVKRENNLTQEELIYTLRQEGITLEEYRESLKREIERFKLVNYEVKSKIVVTEEEVRNYYQSHVMEHTELPQIRLARIFLKVRDPNDKEEIEQRKNLGADILKRLREGEDFCTLARIYSQGPAASEGGDLGWIRVSQLEPLLRKKIANLFPGEYTELEFAGSGFQIIRLVERQQGGEKPFERVRDAIHSKLFREKVEKRYASWLTRLRDESFIKIKF